MNVILFILIIGCWASCLAAPPEPGLLFYLSGDQEFTADYAAGGDPQANFLRGVKMISDGARGRGFECANTQLMSYWAPGNIYAERGTLSFFWRSRYPVGPTAFPIFRVGYSDHSSWDMVWLRIDYNGRGGFDAFVTDINLARIRVSYVTPQFPKPNEWVHLALAWDETEGIRFYVNGVLAARQNQQAVLYAGLDQFGPFSRTIGPMQVQSDYNFTRGGDIDEIRIYDRMLSDANVTSLAKGIAPQQIPAINRALAGKATRDEWLLRYGWNRRGDIPPYLDARETSVRKVEIHDAFDLKRWWWKATDGIRETTWPGVYNRSRLPGRNDYFQLPDWDCYSLSGRSITFTLPDEPWNHLEISGAAWGRMLLEGPAPKTLFERSKGQEKTFHRLLSPIRGQKIRFENSEQEEPIGELSVYNVMSGKEPTGSARLAYTLRVNARSNDPSVEPIRKFIAGRYTEEERSTILATPDTQGPTQTTSATQSSTGSLPLVHVIIPAKDWKEINDGLDGIAIDLPALRVKPTAGAYFPLNIQVKDPLWAQRNLLDFSFSVKPNEARTLWLDTRDRILPEGKAIYLTIAGAGADFGPAALEGARVRLIFKPRTEAVKEHELDRFTQARDSYAMLIEEHTNNPKLNLYNRFAADITDVLRVNPNNWVAQTYWYDSNRAHPKPAFTQPVAPNGVPLWAFRQVEQLRNLNRFVNWYIDNRQIENGEFGGGLSDDGDLTNTWPATALMGCDPEKIKESLRREMNAFYREGMFTNGLPTIQADELHSYEEGIQVLGQSLLLDYGDPRQIERAMETSRAVINLTGINSAGHRHIKSSYYSGTKMAEEEPWGYSKPSSILVLHPGIMLVEYNGNPQIKKIITELADGFLAHRKKDIGGRASLSMAIRFTDDQETPNNRGNVLPILWAAWKWTGNEKYLAPFRDEGARALDLIPSNALDELNVKATWGKEIAAALRTGAINQSSRSNGEAPNSQRLNAPPPPNFGALHFAWQTTGDKHFLESLYGAQIETSALHQYMNTAGSMWIDRVDVPNSELQRARLGGVALVRGSLYPGHAVSWTFAAPAKAEDVAILIPEATPQSVRIIAYNLSAAPVTANLSPWNLEPGQWEVTQGIDSRGDDLADDVTHTRRVELERDRPLSVTLAPRTTTVLTLKLISKGTPYWDRPDLGVGKDDIVIQNRKITVTVHSLGAVDAPATKLALMDAGGKAITAVTVPALKAPLDLMPRKTTVTLKVPVGAGMKDASLVLDPDATVREITRVNNQVKLN
ncbi:MAG TPA: LamG-like jellyroll fold domain-containing protein [Pyrinomonadaceae bacterium]|nr:LamG-like jellyroll fold domain-containing protein [Pyrinomonadaceae bacterium]